ncbi:TetR/AcrR family transcriptional regulator [Saccharopolyspora sp. TS4A08]|uniref:TetR/AcrR family transcriptional regulator n=1 Tax=Saccharopolyspora ipomoeae TaxID=3042027 RepID=A0ABT6PJC1_9PSEU|nr:TetR/AcrR family transcriptional regulator [Saccharopolyspora sp. TS4A08]MDI2028059.1 TetR/AcrR family transcriptional regulator [Saccharopolyspora sp. TS4A08]
MVERTGAGDPGRTLELLWRHKLGEPSAQRGPRKSLSIDQIVDAAVELADSDGLAAVTMRRLADSLGVSTMSMYTYVPGKAELLDLMLDRLFQQMPRAPLDGLPWRERVTLVAAQNRELYREHRWAMQVSTNRLPLGPGLIAKFEHEVGAFLDLGLDDVHLEKALTLVLDFVQSSTRSEVEAQAAQRDSATTDEQWWRANETLLTEVFDPAEYPNTFRVSEAAGAEHLAARRADSTYEFGLQRILDGLAALIEN